VIFDGAVTRRPDVSAASLLPAREVIVPRSASVRVTKNGEFAELKIRRPGVTFRIGKKSLAEHSIFNSLVFLDYCRCPSQAM